MKNTTLTKGSSSVPHVFPPDPDHFHWDSVSTWTHHITPADLSVAHSATNLVFFHPVVVYGIQVWRPLDSSCWWNQFETAAALWHGALLCLRMMVNCGHRTKNVVSNNTLTAAWLIGVMPWSESRKLYLHHIQQPGLLTQGSLGPDSDPTICCFSINPDPSNHTIQISVSRADVHWILELLVPFWVKNSTGGCWCKSSGSTETEPLKAFVLSLKLCS